MHITFLYTSTCTIVSPTLIMSIQFFSETTITVIAKKDKDPEKKYPHHQFAHVRYSMVLALFSLLIISICMLIEINLTNLKNLYHETHLH